MAEVGRRSLRRHLPAPPLGPDPDDARAGRRASSAPASRARSAASRSCSRGRSPRIVEADVDRHARAHARDRRPAARALRPVRHVGVLHLDHHRRGAAARAEPTRARRPAAPSRSARPRCLAAAARVGAAQPGACCRCSRGAARDVQRRDGGRWVDRRLDAAAPRRPLRVRRHRAGRVPRRATTTRTAQPSASADLAPSSSTATGCWSTPRRSPTGCSPALLTEIGLPMTPEESVEAFMGRSWKNVLAWAERARSAAARGLPPPLPRRDVRRLRGGAAAGAGHRRRARRDHAAELRGLERVDREDALHARATPGCGTASRAGSSAPPRSSTASRRPTCSCTPRRRWAGSPPTAPWSRTPRPASRRRCGPG